MEALVRDLRVAVRTLLKSPSFVAAAAGSLALASGANTAIFSLGTRIVVEGHEAASRDGFPVDWNAVTPGYFRTLGLPLVAGKTFDASDAEAAPPVAIVNEALARRFWPGDDGSGARRLAGAARCRAASRDPCARAGPADPQRDAAARVRRPRAGATADGGHGLIRALAGANLATRRGCEL